MRARMMIAAAAAMVLTIAMAGCGGAPGGGAASNGGSGTVKKGGILRIGTTSYIDSLNPFIGIETQSYNAYVMEYPQLVQYGPGLKIEGDWATKWETSSDGKTWTFHLKPNVKWSDGQPMTADDVVWTGNTIIKYAGSAAAALAPALTHITSFEAPDPNTVVVNYEVPVGNVLPQLEQFWILPKHIWEPHVGTKGAGLKTYKEPFPIVSGGAYIITKAEKKGTTVFKPNPNFYGPKSNAEAVALIYYTNSTSMVADLKQGNLDFIDQVPYDAVDSVKGDSRFNVQESPGAEVTNITFNSNPVKPQNRELLDPKVKEALEYATNRSEIVDVIYNGHAKPWANWIWENSGGGLTSPNVKPLPYDPGKANQILDSLGYTKGSDGIRMAPATTGQYAQPAHPMSYQVMVPDSLDFNGDREFQIIRANWAKIGVKITEQPGGDSGQAYAIETAGKYTKFDMALWDWGEYVDPDFDLSVLTRGQWYSWSDTGFNDPVYDAMYKKQGTLVNPDERRQLVWKMQEYIAARRPYINLVEESLITASSTGWSGFDPELGAYCKCYYTTPHQVG
jgi:peptide/nickel transport system substrate-binding protein